MQPSDTEEFEEISGSELDDENDNTDEQGEGHDKQSETARRIEELRSYERETLHVMDLAQKAGESRLASQYLLVPAYFHGNISCRLETLAIKLWLLVAYKICANDPFAGKSGEPMFFVRF